MDELRISITVKICIKFTEKSNRFFHVSLRTHFIRGGCHKDITDGLMDENYDL